MQTVLIVIHLLIVLSLVVVVLLQRSEGGGLGIGGGGGNMMAARASANPLTKITGILAFAFFVTSLSLGILARYGEGPTSILDQIEQQTQGSGEGILDQLGGSPAPQTEPTADGTADVPALPTDGGQDAGNEPAAPAADETAPVEEPAPAEDTSDIPNSGQQTDDAAAPAQTPAPAAEEAAPATGEMAPAAEEAVPADEQAPAATSAPDSEAPAAEEAPAPADEGSDTPAEDAPAETVPSAQ